MDALNTLYVAFTRTKANLYVWGQTKPADKIKSITSIAELIYLPLQTEDNDNETDCFTYEVGSPLTEEDKEDEKANRLALEHRMKDAVDVKVITRNPMLYFLQSNQSQDYLQEQMTTESPHPTSPEGGLQPLPLGGDGGGLSLSQREIGKRMHEVLSRISDLSQLEKVLTQARQEGLIGESSDWDAITKRIKEGFQEPLVASWFKSDNTTYNECSIASIDKETGLPCILPH